jgi:hypothetical protein
MNTFNRFASLLAQASALERIVSQQHSPRGLGKNLYVQPE